MNTKVKLYLDGVEVVRFIKLLECIEKNKLEHVRDIMKVCNVSCGTLYKYLEKARNWGLAKVSIDKKNGVKLTLTRKFYEFKELMIESLKFLEYEEALKLLE